MQNIVIYAFTILYCYSTFLSSAEISPCAKWSPHGKTVAGNGLVGDTMTQLATPRGIFIMKRTNTLYIADSSNYRVQMLPLSQSSSLATTVVFDVREPSKIYVDDDDENGPTIYISVFIGNRVEKWTKGASKGIQLGDECRSCFGIAVDKEKNVYMSELDREDVLKWSPQTNLTKVVAGQTDERGTTDKHLSSPHGLYFDRNSDTLYVADSGNNRIQKWKKDALSGNQVAGSNTSSPNADTGSLDEPEGVWVDELTKIVYVADTMNNRIIRWLPNTFVGDIIAGGEGTGNATNQFNSPSDLAFDSEGNLYVCDTWNHRVQMFSIIDNKPCSLTSTGTRQIYNNWIMIITILSILRCIIEGLF